jgi:hypothetical protein
MKHISRKFWFALSFTIVAASMIFVCKPKSQSRKEKTTHFVVDRLVNQLVCKAPQQRDTHKFTRGVVDSGTSKILTANNRWKRPKRERAEDYCLTSMVHKIFAKRVGRQRNDGPCMPVGL